MLHHIPLDKSGPRAKIMAEAVTSCIHCGFCLPTCPTYEVLGDEADSPRGRIFLMKEVLEGRLQPADASEHIDRCLGCVACETSCPSGVHYGALLSSYRSFVPESTSTRSTGAKWRRKLASWTIPYPTRFGIAIRFAGIGRRLAWLTPPALRPMLDLAPRNLEKAVRFAACYPATGNVRGEVMLHLGCAARVLRPDIAMATIRVLNVNGVTVHVPQDQGCCGALHWHIGDSQNATKMARASLQSFGDSDIPIITTAAGCGSGMREYPVMMNDAQDAETVDRFANRVVDVSVYLDKLGIMPPPPVPPVRVAYHDACHLAHAQKVRRQPRELLRSIPGIELVPLQESDLCCGSAGTYNIDQPEIADQLGARKADNIAASKCDIVAMGNIGCQIQIEQNLSKKGLSIPVLHTIQVLDRAYRSEPIATRK